jgi:hypothetical protein
MWLFAAGYSRRNGIIAHNGLSSLNLNNCSKVIPINFSDFYFCPLKFCLLTTDSIKKNKIFIKSSLEHRLKFCS